MLKIESVFVFAFVLAVCLYRILLRVEIHRHAKKVACSLFITAISLATLVSTSDGPKNLDSSDPPFLELYRENRKNNLGLNIDP